MITSFVDLKREQMILYVERLIMKRQKDFTKADEIRKRLEEMGVDVLAIDGERKGPLKDGEQSYLYPLLQDGQLWRE